MALDRIHPLKKLSNMKKTLFVALFLTIASFSFAKSNITKKAFVVKQTNQSIQVEKRIQENNSVDIVVKYKDQCGQMLTVTLRVFCCLTDTDIANVIEDIALSRFNIAIGCFE
jgi:Icc-related predicted phosphoesterase